MWLVLCQDGDVEAEWLAKALRARTDRAVELVEAGALVHECRWEHRVGAAGVSTRLLVGGTTVDSDRVAAVLNRLSWLGTDGYVAASARDREYAAGEFYALALSWLQGLGPHVINRPTGVGLAGTWRAPAQWCVLARSVGLPIVPYETAARSRSAYPARATASRSYSTGRWWTPTASASPSCRRWSGPALPGCSARPGST